MDGGQTADGADATRYFEAILAREVDANQLRLQLQDGIAVVDARPEVAFVASHIPGAINLPAKAIDSATASHFLAGRTSVVCYGMDSDDLTSVQAALTLAKLGFSTKVLRGGFAAWRGAKYKIEGARA